MTKKVGYCVYAWVAVHDRTNDKVLVPVTEYTCYVQPPPHCRDDPAVLELYLQMHVSLKYLYHLRSLLKKSEAPPAIVGKNWTVRSCIFTYTFHE